jgi:hypothetical protein
MILMVLKKFVVLYLLQIKYVFFIALIFIFISCKKSRLYISSYPKDIGYPKSKTQEFWISPMIPGRDVRSICMDPDTGLYMLWEQILDMPNIRAHSLYGYYEEKENSIVFGTPYGDKFYVKKEKINGIDVILPQSLTVKDAISQSWLMVRRSGASVDDPFRFDELTIFDREPK